MWHRFSEYYDRVTDISSAVRFLLVWRPAVQGHAFAVVRCSHPHGVRVVRRDRADVCLPEIHLGMSFGERCSALIAAKVPQTGLHRVADLGERLPAETAHAVGVVDRTAPLDDVATRSIEIAEALAAKAEPVLPTVRADVSADAGTALDGI